MVLDFPFGQLFINKTEIVMGWFGQLISGQRAECAKILFFQTKVTSFRRLHTKKEKFSTAASLSMTVQSWPQNHRFFKKSRKFLTFQKKNFRGQVVLIEYLQNHITQFLCALIHLVSRVKYQFCPIWGSENKVAPFTTPTRHLGRKIFRH